MQNDDDSILNSIARYTSEDFCPMHMPGHKRNTEMLGSSLPYKIDITEIGGFDKLQDPDGIILKTADLAQELYGSRKSFLLVNGSTAGILAGVSTAVNYGDKIIMARNCHKSVYNAVLINGLKPVYILPETDTETGISGSVTPAQVENALKDNPDARLIVVTSPTYEGVISDIKGIAEAAHRYNIPVLADEAHGAHLGFSGMFPGEALRCGADIVITGLHKTLPSLTQTALAHIGGNIIDENKFGRFLSVFQTSSPSYVLMSSIDSCVRLLCRDKDMLFRKYENNLRLFDKSVSGLKKLKILCHGEDSAAYHPAFFGFDAGKIVISTHGTEINGTELSKILRGRYRIEPEMAYTGYAVAMTGICDTPDNFNRLATALNDIDTDIKHENQTVFPAVLHRLPPQVTSPAEAMAMSGDFTVLENSVGMISLEYVWAYPPGIPIIAPGEIIGADNVSIIKALLSSGIIPKSTYGRLPQFIFTEA